MIFEATEEHPGARFLLILACLVVVVAGLRAAAPILVPFALALFLAIVSMPVMFTLRMRRVPAPLAILLTVLLDVLIFGFVVLLAANSVGNLNDRLPRYQSALQVRFQEGVEWLTDRGVPAEALNLPELLDPGSLFGFLGTTLQTVASVFSLGFLVALISVFILAEATIFPFKFQAILGHDRQGRVRITKTIEEVQVYLGIKTLVSLATGVLAGVFCWLMNLDFPILLGLTAFALNYVPTIGSIIAAIPAMILALILHDVSWMLLVGLGYMGINTLFGNIIEPNLMGRRLGLSTLVVVLSLLFWGWLWGPAGALLSVPLTMVLKIVLENTPDLRWAAVLLDKVPPQARRSQERAAAPETPPPPSPPPDREAETDLSPGPDAGPTRATG
jgi:predicted PurR-regulated permease PerM